jgi:hypothetical protein
LEAKKREILEQTKLSLQEVGRQYQEQRRFIEEQLEKRRQLKLQGKSSSECETRTLKSHLEL